MLGGVGGPPRSVVSQVKVTELGRAKSAHLGPPGSADDSLLAM